MTHQRDAQEYEIVGICENCQNEIWGRRRADGDLVIEPCPCCLNEAFNQGHEAGCAERMELEYRRWLDRRLFH
ncbi:hypothetical protein [Thermogutta sp.]|uniref:hypothetical protein n=1 Tax=Thermogutta sp. TaxID=1962930 RepID=UPI003C7C9E8D